MVLRETMFVVGGALTIGLGVALGSALAWAGAGFEFFGGWLAAALAVAFGALFVYVGRAEGRERRRELDRLESHLEDSAGRRSG